MSTMPLSTDFSGTKESEVNIGVVGKLILVKEAPKGLHWKLEVDGREFEDEESLLDSVRSMIRGKVYFYRTNFGKSYFAPSRKKHFKDGYWVYTFWFARKADAALAKLVGLK
jgi:hypothetical protein